jgi:membrane fusion protein, adhesin transport system
MMPRSEGSRSLGQLTRVHPFLTVMALVAAPLLIASAIGALWAPWRQVVHGEGRVIALSPLERKQQIHAPVPGRVVHWHVGEGSRVAQGDPLVEIADVDPGYVGRLETRVEAERQRLGAVQKQRAQLESQVVAYSEARAMRVQAAQLQVKMSEQKLLAAEEREKAAESEARIMTINFARTVELAAQGLAAERQKELAELDVAKADAALGLARAAVAEAKAARMAAQADVLRAQAEGGAKVAESESYVQKASADIAYAQNDLAKVTVERSRQDARIVRAPVAGTIVRIEGSAGGGMVAEGQVLAYLVPDSTEQAVELFVDGRDASLVTVGRQVRLEFDGFPAVHFSGWPRSATGTFPALVRLVDPAAHDAEGRVRVLVVPDPAGPAWPSGQLLRQEVRARGWLLLNEVTVGWEIWRQLSGFPLGPPPPPPEDSAKPAKKKGKKA